MQALDAYKRTSGRMFPTCSEILEVIRASGYVKVTMNAEPAASVAPQAAPIAGPGSLTRGPATSLRGTGRHAGRARRPVLQKHS